MRRLAVIFGHTVDIVCLGRLSDSLFTTFSYLTNVEVQDSHIIWPLTLTALRDCITWHIFGRKFAASEPGIKALTLRRWFCAECLGCVQTMDAVQPPRSNRTWSVRPAAFQALLSPVAPADTGCSRRYAHGLPRLQRR